MMTRQLLVGTALAVVLATGAFAQSSSSAVTDTSSATSSSAASSAPASTGDTPSSSSAASDQGASSAASDQGSSSALDSSAMSSQMSTASSQDSSMMSSAQTTTTTNARTPVQILSGYTQVDTDRLASKIIGSPVYDGKAKDSNKLGDIKDLVLNENGEVAAVVVGVGGFLGLGEKQVAVDFAALQFLIADDNTERYVLQTTKDELTNAPDFKTVDDNPASNNNGNGNASDANASGGNANAANADASAASANGAAAGGTGPATSSSAAQ